MITATPLYLASQSPRRKELLSAIGLTFSVYVPKSPEIPAPRTAKQKRPADIVAPIAKAKAHAAYTELLASGVREGLILSADTLVFLEGEVLGKPKDEKDARRMLRKLSGRSHTVATGIHIALFQKGALRREQKKTILTKVQFFPISPKDLDWYLATGEPFDKAGAYGAQHFGGAFIEKFQGSYTNVVGLPVAETLRLLATVAGRPWQTWTR